MDQYPDQTRNLNPTPEAVVACIMFGDRYAAQKDGTMDFWGKLSKVERRRCELVVEYIEGQILQAIQRYEKGFLKDRQTGGNKAKIEAKIAELKG